MAAAAPGSRESLSFGKRALFSLATLLISLVAVELGVRVIFALRVGPTVLLHGLKSAQLSVDSSVEHPDHRVGPYAKYTPHQLRVDRDHESGELFQVRINSRGFRGEDVAPEKPPGVVRVVTLGASSTFGYYSRDEQTYPRLLEQILNERSHGALRFEVVNLGIPHSTSTNLVALFLAEALPLQPDVVTFYSGINDMHDRLNPPAVTTDVRGRLKSNTAIRSSYRWIRDHLLSVQLADGLLFSGTRDRYAKEQVAGHAVGKSERFLANTALILQESRDRDIEFIVATQQAQSQILGDRQTLAGVSYSDEVAMVQAKLDREGWVTRRERDLVTHSVLMEELRAWARAEGVPLVDIVEVLDRDRDVLLSWVHLDAKGNRMIAESFADTILPRIEARW